MSDTPTRYAKLENGYPVYARDVIPTKTGFIAHPTEAELLANGWVPVDSGWTPPEPAPEGKMWSRTGKWLEHESSGEGDPKYIYPEYVLRTIPPTPPRTFSKLKIVSALMSRNVWPEVKTYIETAGFYDLYLAAQVFRDDNLYFKDGLSALKTQLGWTDDQVEDVLSECIAEV